MPAAPVPVHSAEAPDPALEPATRALADAFARHSPRRTGQPTPWPSLAIHGAVLLAWIGLVLGALGLGGLLAWSVGIAYVLYDSALLSFTFLTVRGLPTAIAAAAAPVVSAADGTSETSLGIVVAAHNEAAVLPVTLAAIIAQLESGDTVVVADDGSSDGTAALLVARYGLSAPIPGFVSCASASHPGLRWLRLPHGGKARALNAAVLQLDTAILVTVDADTLLEPGALAGIRAAFRSQPALVAATGILTPVCADNLQGRVLEWFQTYEYIRNFLSRRAWMQVDGLLLISGALAAFRRAPVLAVGGFDPQCLVEDYELIHRMRRHGALAGLHWTTAVLGDVRGQTEAPGSLAAFLRQRRRWFGGFLQTQYWYRGMVGSPQFGNIGTRMLPVKAIDALQPLFGLTALAVLTGHLLRGDWGVVVPVSGVILAKIVLDLAFHLWSVHAYRSWTGAQGRAHISHALLAALAEPFSFQILRHTAAALGWWLFLSGRMRWGRQSRGGLLAVPQEVETR